ncbi:MAG: hypothetical protein MUP81_03220 [Dehalococcoidia bacterium]|nr:hypothetical protein [Dehalococcoidia bacterium]
MRTYYEVQIIATGKGYAAKEGYRQFNAEQHAFGELSEAVDFVKNKYGNCKRVPMFRDNPNKEPYQCGWIYCFNNDDISHVPVEKWRQQDWVEIRRCEDEVLLPNVINW